MQKAQNSANYIQNCPHTLHNRSCTQWSAHRAHIAVRMLGVRTVECTLHITWCAHSGQCSENGWCARDRKWRRGVRAVASWTPARAQLAHCVLINFCTICATFSRQYQGLAHCCAVIETRHLRRFNRRHFERASIRACAESVSERLKGVEKEKDGVVGLARRAGHRGEGFGQLRCGRSFNLIIIGSVHMLQCDYSWLTRRGWP